VDKFVILIPDKFEVAYRNAIKKVLGDEHLEEKIAEAYLLSKQKFRQAIVDAWNEKHPALPGRLTMKTYANKGKDEKTSLLISNNKKE
jgi:hypothetical protein